MAELRGGSTVAGLLVESTTGSQQKVDKLSSNLSLNGGANVHWGNLTNVPAYDNYGSWTISDGTNTEAIGSGATLKVVGSGASSASYDASTNTLTISSTDTNTNTWRPIHDAPSDGATTTSISSNWAFDITGVINGKAPLNNAEMSNNIMYSTVNDDSYTATALEIRELNRGSAQTGSQTEAPRISFHWGGRVASQIALSTDGSIMIRDNPGTGYEDLRANNIYANGSNLVWHSGNDGAGSGLDADRVQGHKYTVSTTAPSSPSTNDIWIDVS